MWEALLKAGRSARRSWRARASSRHVTGDAGACATAAGSTGSRGDPRSARTAPAERATCRSAEAGCRIWPTIRRRCSPDAGRRRAADLRADRPGPRLAEQRRSEGAAEARGRDAARDAQARPDSLERGASRRRVAALQGRTPRPPRHLPSDEACATARWLPCLPRCPFAGAPSVAGRIGTSVHVSEDQIRFRCPRT